MDPQQSWQQLMSTLESYDEKINSTTSRCGKKNCIAGCADPIDHLHREKELDKRNLQILNHQRRVLIERLRKTNEKILEINGFEEVD